MQSLNKLNLPCLRSFLSTASPHTSGRRLARGQGGSPPLVHNPAERREREREPGERQRVEHHQLRATVQIQLNLENTPCIHSPLLVRRTGDHVFFTCSCLHGSFLRGTQRFLFQTFLCSECGFFVDCKLQSSCNHLRPDHARIGVSWARIAGTRNRDWRGRGAQCERGPQRRMMELRCAFWFGRTLRPINSCASSNCSVRILLHSVHCKMGCTLARGTGATSLSRPSRRSVRQRQRQRDSERGPSESDRRIAVASSFCVAACNALLVRSKVLAVFGYVLQNSCSMESPPPEQFGMSSLLQDLCRRG